MGTSLMSGPRAVLQFGNLVLVTESPIQTPFSISALGDEWNFGKAEVVTTVIDSLLGDGQLVSIARHNNREAQIGIQITAADGLTLAMAEAELIAETEKRNTLTWVPPDQFGPTTVFDVVTSWAEHTFSDEDEMRLVRRYVLTLQLYPHPRSASTTTVAAIGTGIDPADAPTYTLVNDGSSLTGWSGRIPTVTTDTIQPVALGGTPAYYVYQTARLGYDLFLEQHLSSTQDWTATPYIYVDWKAVSGDAGRQINCYVSGVQHEDVHTTKISEGPSPLGGGYSRSIFLIPMAQRASIRYVKFFKGNDLPNDGSNWSFRISEFGRTDGGAANDGTSRQLARSLEIGGTAAAMGSITMKHNLSSLGDVLIWTGPAACSVPALRRRRTGGAGAIADTSLVSGAYEDIGTTAFAADVELEALPSAAYLVMARLKATDSTGDHLVDVTANTYIDQAGTLTAVGQTLLLDDARVALDTTTFKIVTLGVMHLPATEVAASASGVVRVTLKGTGVRLDEAWLFNITDGDLTKVTGVPRTLQLTSPTLDDPRRRTWISATAPLLGVDYYDAGSQLEMRGAHMFTPGEWAVFTVSTGAQNAAVTVTYDKRWHSNAGEEG